MIIIIISLLQTPQFWELNLGPHTYQAKSELPLSYVHSYTHTHTSVYSLNTKLPTGSCHPQGAFKDTMKQGHLLALGVEVLDQILQQIHSFFNLDFIDLQQILLRNKGRQWQKSASGSV